MADLLSTDEAERIAAAAQAVLEADRAAQADTLAMFERTQQRLRAGLAECAERTAEREKRILAHQQSSQVKGDALDKDKADAQTMLDLIAAEERRLECAVSTEVSVERDRLEKHRAELQHTHEEARRLQDDLMRKREHYVQGRETLQAALESLNEEKLDVHDWFFMPASRLGTGHELARPSSPTIGRPGVGKPLDALGRVVAS